MLFERNPLRHNKTFWDKAIYNRFSASTFNQLGYCKYLPKTFKSSFFLTFSAPKDCSGEEASGMDTAAPCRAVCPMLAALQYSAAADRCKCCQCRVCIRDAALHVATRLVLCCTMLIVILIIIAFFNQEEL